MHIGQIDIARNVLVVAEIGNNHEGDFGRAQEMIHRAAEAGAQAVKFQTIDPARLVRPDQTARLAQLGRFAFDRGQFERLAETAAGAGVLFLSTPFSLDSVDWLDPLVPAFKIASGDNDFAPLIARAAATGKPLLVSTGMCDAGEVAALAARLARLRPPVDGRIPGLVLLHCVSAYPAEPAAANLRAIAQLESLGAIPGYSDHTLGVEAAVASVALGARVIEKHFTLSKTQSDFRDHQLSADPSDLAELVRRVRALESMLGDGVKRVEAAERGVAEACRRSLCAARDLPAGHVVSPQDLAWLRPGEGMAPGREAELVGRALVRPLAAGQPFAPDLLVSAAAAE